MENFKNKKEIDQGFIQIIKVFFDHLHQNHLELRRLTIDAMEGK